MPEQIKERKPATKYCPIRLNNVRIYDEILPEPIQDNKFCDQRLPDLVSDLAPRFGARVAARFVVLAWCPDLVSDVVSDLVFGFAP